MSSKTSEDNINRLKKNFRCPKCRGKEAIARRISLSTSPLSGFIPLVSGKFYSLTCLLCGYTELYDETVYEKQSRKADKDIRATQEA